MMRIYRKLPGISIHTWVFLVITGCVVVYRSMDTTVTTESASETNLQRGLRHSNEQVERDNVQLEEFDAEEAVNGDSTSN